jgi:hypothetical protein
MAYRFLNNARMTVASAPGTGDITVGTAVLKFQDFVAAGLTDGDTAHFRAEDGNDWELFLGTWDVDSTTLTRTLVASSSGALLSLTSSAEIEAVPVAEALALLEAEINLPRAADTFSYFTGALTKALATLSTFARTDLLTLADVAALEALLQLELLATTDSVTETTTNRRTANYVLTLADKGKTIEMNVASANTLTIPPNSTVPFPVGSYVNFVQYGAGQVTITPGSGVTLRNPDGLKTAKQYAMGTLYKTGTDEWIVSGNMAI